MPMILPRFRRGLNFWAHLTMQISRQDKSRVMGLDEKSMKFAKVTQWVKVPPNQSLANRLVVNPAGKSGNGSPKPGGARVQAV
jgi:hypothetical protein